jgi:hypothetical protein
MGTKWTKHDFQTTQTNASLILDLSHGIKKSKAKTWCVYDVNARGLYYKNMAITNQDHNKNTYPKLILNKLKVT